MSKGQALRGLVMERLVVAADEIFALFERTIAEYEEEALRSKLLQETRQEPQKKCVQALSVNPEIGPSLEQTMSMKQEEDLPLEFPLTSVSVKSEDKVEKSFQQELPEEDREEPGCSFLYLESDKGKQTYSCSDTDDSDDWEPSAKRSTTCHGQKSKTVHRKCTKRGRAEQTTKRGRAEQTTKRGRAEQTTKRGRAEQTTKHGRAEQNSKLFFTSENAFSDESSNTPGNSDLNNEDRKCPCCEEVFQCEADLQNHLLTHSVSEKHFSLYTEEKPFSCSVCKKGFSQEYYLRRHMLNHTKEKPFGCSVCKKRFWYRSQLKDHVNTHIGEKPFSCPECDLKFTTRHNVERHISSIHKGEKPYSCPVCEKAFAQKSDFIRHIHRTHIVEVQI